MARKPKVTREEELRAELARQRGKALDLTPENIAKGHLRQLEMFRALETHDHLLAVCARQIGKTEFNMGALGLTAMKTPGAQCLYLGLDDGAAEEVFETKWKDFCQRFQLPVKHAGQVTSFNNGARVVFGGLTHARHAATYLGKSMAGGICVIDEAQDQPGLIRDAIVDLIGPMLAQRTVEKPNRGKLVITGTCPAVHAGYFWEVWRQGLDENLDIVPDADPYARFNISRFENVHLGGYEGARRELDIENATNKTTDASPVQQRNWFGNYRVVDATKTAFRYNAQKNSYIPKLAAWACDIAPGKMIATDMPADCDTVHLGIDPGASDKFSIVWWYSHSRRPVGLIHGGEWVTERNANAGWNQAGQVLDLVDAHVRGGITHLFYDAGGSNVTMDLFSKTVGRRALTAANKTDLFGRVERMASLFESGEAKVISGSQLERDYQFARFDPEARAERKYKWMGLHPDPAMASMYACDRFWDVRDQQAPKTAKSIAELEEEAFLEAQRRGNAAGNYGPPADLADSGGGYGPSSDW